MADITTKLHDYIVNQFPQAKAQNIGTGDSLLTNGIIDSLGILDMVTFIENEFGIMFEDEDLLGESFETIDSLAALVQSKLEVRT